MEWLSQNWIWLVLIVGAMMMLSRGRHGGAMGGCCGMAHESPAGEGKALSTDAPGAPGKNEKAGRSAQPGPSAHNHGGGGCC